MSVRSEMTALAEQVRRLTGGTAQLRAGEMAQALHKIDQQEKTILVPETFDGAMAALAGQVRRLTGKTGALGIMEMTQALSELAVPVRLADAESGIILGYASRDRDIVAIAPKIAYFGETMALEDLRKYNLTVNTIQTFAGWFASATPLTAAGAETDKVTDLTTAPETIYAHWIDAGYLKTTIAYTSGASTATKTYTISTVPDDLFSLYGFVMSTKAVSSQEQLVIGGTVEGTKVGNFSKTTVFTNISVAPFSPSDPKMANDFNGNLGGANQGNGYITYALAANLPVGKTLSVRAYYKTKDGTVVYGPMTQKLLAANASDTGI